VLQTVDKVDRMTAFRETSSSRKKKKQQPQCIQTYIRGLFFCIDAEIGVCLQAEARIYTCLSSLFLFILFIQPTTNIKIIAGYNINID